MAAPVHHRKKRRPYHLKKKRTYKGRRHFHQKHKRKTESRRGWAAKNHRRGDAASVRTIQHRVTKATRYFVINSIDQKNQRIRSIRGYRSVNAPKWSARVLMAKQSPQHMRVPRHRWF